MAFNINTDRVFRFSLLIAIMATQRTTVPQGFGLCGVRGGEGSESLAEDPPPGRFAA